MEGKTREGREGKEGREEEKEDAVRKKIRREGKRKM